MSHIILKCLKIFLLFATIFLLHGIKCDGYFLDEPSDNSGYITIGIFRENLVSPIFYETFVPLIFKYKTRKWNNTDVTFNNWYTCISETAPYRFSCPVVFHMNKAVVNLHTDFDPVTPDDDSSSQDNFYLKLISHSQFCDKIQKHFHGPYIENNDLEQYIDHLNSCRFQTQSLDTKNTTGYVNNTETKYIYSIRDPFIKMENNFYNVFYKNILNSSNGTTSLDRVSSALLSNSRMSLQASILGFYYAERNRWIHAETSCATQLIPYSLLKRNEFLETINRIQTKFLGETYDLSIKNESISKYYNLPLTDCTHSKQIFVVRILVPIIRKMRGQLLQLIQLHNTPFYYKDHLCHLKLENGNTYIFNEFTGTAYPSKCHPNSLCSVTDSLMENQVRDPCVSPLLSQNYNEVRSHCDFKCIPIVKDSSTAHSYIAHRIASNKYVITKLVPTSKSQVSVKCENFRTNLTALSYPKGTSADISGAWLITLPCDCKIIIAGHQQLYSDLPCIPGPTSLVVDWIIPLHFTNQSVHEPWNGNDAVTLRTYDENREFFTENLSRVIDETLIKSYIVKRRHNVEENHKEVEGTSASKLSASSHTPGNELLWSVFLITVSFIIVIQIFIIYEIRVLKRITYPKDDMILNHMHESPRALHIM